MGHPALPGRRRPARGGARQPVDIDQAPRRSAAAGDAACHALVPLGGAPAIIIPVRIGGAHHVAGAHVGVVQPRPVPHRVRFALLFDQQVPAVAVGLAAGGAVHGGHVAPPPAIAGDQGIVHDQLHALLVAIGGIGEAHGGGGVARARRRSAAVAEPPVRDVRRTRQRHGVGGALADGHDAAAAVVHRGAEVGEHAGDEAGGVGAPGDDAAEPEPRFAAAHAVVDELVAEAGQIVEQPLGRIEIRRGQVLAEAEAPRLEDVVDAPGAVVGPGGLERAVPEPGVGAGVRVVVRRHVHQAPVHLVFPLVGLAAVLVGLGDDGDQGGVRIALAHLVDGLEPGPLQVVVDPLRGRVRIGARHAHVVGRRALQRDPERQLGRAVGLVVDRLLHDGGVGAAAGLDLDPEAHRGGAGVAVRGDRRQAREPQRDAGGVRGAGDGSCPGRARGHLQRPRRQRRDGFGDAFGRLLVGQPEALLDGDPFHVQRAVGRLDRRAVDVDGLEPVGEPADRTLAEQVHGADRGAGLERHAAFHGAPRFGRAAAAAAVAHALVPVEVPVPVLVRRLGELHALVLDAAGDERGAHAHGAAVDERHRAALGGAVPRAAEEVALAGVRVLRLVVVGQVRDLGVGPGGHAEGGGRGHQGGGLKARAGLARHDVQGARASGPHADLGAGHGLAVEHQAPVAALEGGAKALQERLAGEHGLGRGVRVQPERALAAAQAALQAPVQVHLKHRGA